MVLHMQHIVEQMQAVSADCDRQSPDAASQARLTELTGKLLDAEREGASEYARFDGARHRRLDLSAMDGALRSAYAGRRIAITGGTGCIGTQLLRELRALGAGPMFSITRGLRSVQPMAGVSYLTADVRDADALRQAVLDARPDIIFHLAAQRDPGFAETAVAETVMTNIIGTRNLLNAARAADVEYLSFASTGKAMRYFTKDVYAASKKVGEWLLHVYAGEGRAASASRFTHVVDNSIVVRKFREAIPSGLIRIHDPGIEFYVQSATESAQLVLLAPISAGELGNQFAIRDLGLPARLLPMALGVLRASGQRAGILFPGYDPGYEPGLYPGLYDPRTSGDLSPLIIGVEAATATDVVAADTVNRFDLSLPADAHSVTERIADQLQEQCEVAGAAEVAQCLRGVSVEIERATFAAADPALLHRLQRAAIAGGRRLPIDDARIGLHGPTAATARGTVTMGTPARQYALS
jgi:hypothetical protein